MTIFWKITVLSVVIVGIAIYEVTFSIQYNTSFFVITFYKGLWFFLGTLYWQFFGSRKIKSVFDAGGLE